MFKRYKLQTKKYKPLAVRAKRVGTAKRITEEMAKIVAMLKNTSTIVRMRGAREAEKLESVGEEMAKEIVKMALSEKKDVRKTFYTVCERLLYKALPAEIKVWEELLVLYITTMQTCTMVDLRKDAVNMIDIMVKHYPARVYTMRDKLIKWLENDIHIVNIDAQYDKWKTQMQKRIRMIQAVKKTEHTKSMHTDRINMLHMCIVVNGVARRY